MKEFRTNEELIDSLTLKGITVLNKNEALNIVNKYSFYNIVNTYKFPFKNVDGSYVKSVTFEEILALYNFDKHIRILFLKYLLNIEESLKGKISQILSINYGIEDCLNESNFDEYLDDEIINKLLNKINKDIAKHYEKHDAFKNYKSKYGFIPPYILMKGLSFGEISKLYGILKQSDRQYISRQFQLSDKTLKQILINLTLVRNICAHSDRLFSLKSKFKIAYKNSNSETMILSPNLRIIIDCMKIFLSEEEFEIFKNEFMNELNILNNNVKSLEPNVLLNLMGFLN